MISTGSVLLLKDSDKKKFSHRGQKYSLATEGTEDTEN